MRNARELGKGFRTRPSPQPGDIGGVMKRALDETCALFGAKDALLVWEEAEEPWVVIASLTGERFAMREEKATAYEPLVADALDRTSFWSDSSSALTNEGEVLGDGAIHAALRREVASSGVLSFPIVAATGGGRVFVASTRPNEVDATLLAADAAGRLIGEVLDRHLHVAAATADAVEQERVRLARDLHDGLLQSFTGIVLQLETAHSILASQPDEAKRMLTEAEAALMADQRELRSYVQQLGPRATRPEVVFDFGARIEELGARLEQQWGIRLSADVTRVDPSVSQFLGYETFRLVHEAVMNSAKHGAAKNVVVRVHTAEGKMRIEVSDDGVGFSFRGRLTLDRIRETGSGPFMLAERVAALNGDLTVDSSEAGAHLEIAVPLGFIGEAT